MKKEQKLDFSNRIVVYAKSKKMSVRQFELSCGFKSGWVGNIKSQVDIERVNIISANYPDLNIDWLFTGNGEMLKGEIAGTTSPDSLPMLPFSAVAGFLAENNSGFGRDMEMCTVPAFLAKGADFLIRVEGDSMYPRYHNGEILAVKTIQDPTFFQWGKVYVLSTNQGCIVKRLFPDPADDMAIVCHSENTENYPDYKITKGDILHVGVVVGHIGIE